MTARGMRLAALSLLGAAAAAASVYAAGRIDLRAFPAWLETVPHWLLLLIVFGTPLAGMPLSLLLVAVGLAFPLPLGLAVVVAVFVVHHLLIFLLSKTRLYARLRGMLARRRMLPAQRTGGRLGDHLLFILAATWVPGLSYIFKVALTALAGIPFRTYLIGGVLSQTLAAVPYLVLGHLAEHADLAWLAAAVFVIAALAWVLKRSVSRYRSQRFSDRAGRP